MNYFILLYCLVAIISGIIGFEIGWHYGINFTLTYFKTHPIPDD